jgi:hypothetical protein
MPSSAGRSTGRRFDASRPPAKCAPAHGEITCATQGAPPYDSLAVETAVHEISPRSYLEAQPMLALLASARTGPGAK